MMIIRGGEKERMMNMIVHAQQVGLCEIQQRRALEGVCSFTGRSTKVVVVCCDI
jgi:hypothetical protein